MTCARESFVKQSLPLHIGRAKCRHELTITSRLPGIVRMEDALIEIDKRIYFGLVEDGCGWIENRLDSHSTSAACAAIRTLSAAANDLTHLREAIIASCR